MEAHPPINSVNLAAIVVLYYPPKDIIENISSYINACDLIIAYKNSPIEPETEERLIRTFKDKLILIGTEENLGIGKALNEGMKHAQEKKFDWALTMDQDSNFTQLSPPRSVQKNIGLIYPKYSLEKTDIDNSAPWIMTSGNIVNISIWEQIGKYNENYFIDGVDFEYCMRLQRHKKTLHEEPNMILEHKLGTSVKFGRFLFLTYRVATHPPIRQYYIFRNYLTIAKQYALLKPRWSAFLLWVIFIRFAKLYFFEKKDQNLIKMAIQGLRDSAKKPNGKCPYQ